MKANAKSEGPPPSRPEFKQEASGGCQHPIVLPLKNLR